MKKIYIILIISAVALFILFIIFYLVFFNKKWRDRWLTYENSRYEFSVDYPVDWKLGEEEINNAGREFTSPDEKAICYAYGFANALTNDSGEPQTLDEFIDWIATNGSETGSASEITERKESKLDGLRAIQFVSKHDSNIQDTIYALGKENGIGIYCTYDDAKQREKYEYVFDRMVESTKINLNLDGDITTGTNSCDNLLSKVVTPLNDLETFFDTNYTEVTLQERENWDRSRLPDKVAELENNDYICYPTPIEFENQSAEEINSERAVSKVQWQCELEYQKWQYLEDNKEQLSALKKEGYSCKKEDCLDKNNQVSFLWLCTQ